MLPRRLVLVFLAHFKCYADARRAVDPMLATLGSAEDAEELDSQESKVSNRCGYNNEAFYDEDKAERDRDGQELAASDPRVTVRQHGWRKGLWAKLLMLRRGVINTKVVALELSGIEAQTLAQAMYGIVTTRVPEKCFPLLKNALTVQGDLTCIERSASKPKASCYKDMAKLKENQKEVLRIIQTLLPLGCDEGGTPPPKKSPLAEEIKRVENDLWPLVRGYWGLYELLTDADKSTISVRNLDELRVLRNELRVRQVWFYGKVHTMQFTEFTLRQQLRHAEKNRMRSEVDRLWRQIKNVYLLQEMADAHLEFIELDNVGSCEPAMKYGPEPLFLKLGLKLQGHALGGYQSAMFRVTLMFRERHWQSRGKAVARFFQHPILSMKKTLTRFGDQFWRAQPPVKIGMIIKPLMKVAILAGVVLGTVTAGGTTFAVLFADLMVSVGIEVACATVPFVEWLVNEAIGILTGPVKDFLLGDLIARGFAKKQTQYAISFIDQVPRKKAFAKQMSDMYGAVENIITEDKVRKQMEFILEMRVANDENKEANEALKEDIEDEVRDYVRSMVFQGFVEVIVPVIHKDFHSRKFDEDHSFGWLSWKDWKEFRSKEDAKKKITLKYKDKEVRYAGDDTTGEPAYEGTVVDVPWRYVGQNRKLIVEIADVEGKPWKTVELTDKVQSLMSIRDPVAFYNSQTDWLSWDLWHEYRDSGNSSNLKGKMISFDRNRPECGDLSQSCLSAIANYDGETRVSSTRKLWTRQVWVKSAGAAPCSFYLYPQVKSCLLVKDHEAFKASEAASPHRQKAKEYGGGKLRAAGNILNDVIQGIRDLGSADPAQMDAVAETIIEKESGQQTDAFATAAVEDDLDADAVVVMDQATRGFAAAYLGIPEAWPEA